jgi:hypothetical protein
VDLAAVAAGLIFAAAGGIEWRRSGLSEARLDLDAVPLTNTQAISILQFLSRRPRNDIHMER